MRTIYPNARAVLVMSVTALAALFLLVTQYHSSSSTAYGRLEDNGAAIVPRDIRIRARMHQVEEPRGLPAIPPRPPSDRVQQDSQHADFIDEPRKQPDEDDQHVVEAGDAAKVPEAVEARQQDAPEVEKDAAKEEETEEKDEKPPVEQQVVVEPPKPSADDEENAQRREKIKEMMRFAWSGYRNYSWGANELKPISKTSHSQSIFGGADMAATIVDAADTLWIMGLKDEYEQARDFIKANFSINKATGTLSVFETTIRFVGGLLSLHGLTKEDFYINKAKEVADVLLPAFNTPSGIAKSLVTPSSKSSNNYGWAQSGSSILAEFGSLHLEFMYLSELTGNPIYREKVEKIRNVLDRAEKKDGLYSNYMSPETGKFSGAHVSLGALGDSFYEYLLKSYIHTAKTDEQAYHMYKNASAAIQKHMVFTSQGGLRYVAELRNMRPEHKMGHLACFCPGMFALEADLETDPERKATTLKLAEDLGNTCHESYIRSATRIGPEMFYFSNPQKEAMTEHGDSGYIQRPEVIEGFFYLWRITKNKKYKEWVWDAITAIEKHCRVDAGYAGLRDVYKPEAGKDDVQQSFFLAETLKYAYLTFADDEIPLSKWVFNTEAHPFPISANLTRRFSS
ncbi:Protein MANS-2 a [Aphelenchoides avenae]|nr:Protein MANS-2 a [Aphelenchus avenae]